MSNKGLHNARCEGEALLQPLQDQTKLVLSTKQPGLLTPSHSLKKNQPYPEMNIHTDVATTKQILESRVIHKVRRAVTSITDEPYDNDTVQVAFQLLLFRPKLAATNTAPICSKPGCRRKVMSKNSKFCVSHVHNGKYQCHYPGCDNTMRISNLCTRHSKLRCKTPGCSLKAISKAGHCLSHSKNRISCSVRGCIKAPRVLGKCYLHSSVMCSEKACFKKARGSHGLCNLHRRKQS